jgi:hypothetical protein
MPSGEVTAPLEATHRCGLPPLYRFRTKLLAAEGQEPDHGGVSEVPIVPPMAAVANAIADAIGVRLRDLPMSPPRLRAAIDSQEPVRRAAE